jgi:hypothetical protein
MHGPVLVAWLLVALSAAAALSCLVRAEDRDEAVMGAGMAVMALPVSVLDPRPWGAPVFAVVYAGAALRAVLPGGHCTGHRLHHLVCSAAMVYMAVATARAAPAGTGHAMAMGTGGAVPTGLFLLYFAGYVLRTGVRLAVVPAPAPARLIPGPAGSAGPVPGPAAPRLRHAPEVAVACRVSMALAMVAMLLMM